MFSKYLGFPFLIAIVAVVCLSLSAAAQQSGESAPSQEAFNKKPLKDWLKTVKEANDRGELNLAVPTEVVIEVERTASGEFANPLVMKNQGDPKLALHAINLVAALVDSRALQFLNYAERLRLVFNFTEAGLRFEASFDAPTPERAGMIAKSYGHLFYAAKVGKTRKPEQVVYENIKVSSSEKEVLFSLSITREDAVTLLNKLSTD